MTAAFTLLSVKLEIHRGGRTYPSEVSASLDPIRTQEAARSAGRQLGEVLGDVLAMRLQQGESLT